MFYRNHPADEFSFSLNFVQCCTRLKLNSSCFWADKNHRSVKPLNQGGPRFSVKQPGVHFDFPIHLLPIVPLFFSFTTSISQYLRLSPPFEVLLYQKRVQKQILQTLYFSEESSVFLAKNSALTYFSIFRILNTFKKNFLSFPSGPSSPWRVSSHLEN
jgi:hypothetical protein